MSAIELEIQSPAATLWLNRPDVANALNAEMVAELNRHLEVLEQRSDIRVVFVRGRGGKFCAGADLKELVIGSAGISGVQEMELSAILERLAALPLVVVAVIERFALGGGFLISVACDLRVATTGAKLGFARLAQHWIPPCGLSRIASWVGPAHAQQIVLARSRFVAEEAQRMGLIDYVVEPSELESILAQLQTELATTRADVVREAKQFFALFQSKSHAEWDRISAVAFEHTFSQPAAQQAIRSFLSSSDSNRVPRQPHEN